MMTVFRVISWFLAPLTVVLPLQAAPGTAATLRFPVVLNIDVQTVQTSMLLKVPITTYGIGGCTIEELESGQADPSERTVAIFLKSMRSPNLQDYRELVYWPPAKEFSRLSPGTITTSLSFEEQLTLWRTQFDAFRNVRVEARVTTGLGDLFVWKVETPTGRRRTGVLVLLVQGKRRVAWVQSGYPVEALIANTLDQAPGAYMEEKSVGLSQPRAFALPLDKNDIALEFDGQHLDAQVGTSSSLPPPAQVLSDAIGKFRKREKDVLGLFTDWSQTILTQSHSAKDSRGFEAMCAQQSSIPSHMKFILNADPVFIIFMAPRAGNTWGNESLEFRYVFASGDSIKITNVNSEGSLDRVFLYSKYLPQFLKRSRTGTPAASPGAR